MNVSRDRDVITPFLLSRGYEVCTAGSLLQGRTMCLQGAYTTAVFLLDGVSELRAAIDEVEGIAVRAPHMRFVLVHGDREILARHSPASVVQAPVKTQVLLDTIANVHRESSGEDDWQPICRRDVLLGESRAMQSMFDELRRVAPTNANVLLMGETGTGKELVAHAIHGLYRTNGEPFVALHCASLPQSLLESELFGHVKGSFTGATTNRRGAFEMADTGTLFLDEVATINPQAQVKLLRVLQDHCVQPVGANKSTRTDFRLIAATNRDLHSEVRAGRFREDLFYRLNVFPIQIPPLRERPEDIPTLARYFCERFATGHGIQVPNLPGATIASMQEYDWPGNVRELQGFVERAVILSRGEEPITFSTANLLTRPFHDGLSAEARENLWSLAQLERQHILNVLEDMHGHRTKAASVLGISRRTLSRKLQQYQGTTVDA